MKKRTRASASSRIGSTRQTSPNKPSPGNRAIKRGRSNDSVKCVMCGKVVPRSKSIKRGFTKYSIFCIPCIKKIHQHQNNTAQAAEEAKERKAKRSIARKANPKPVKKGKKDQKYAKDGEPSKSVFTVWSGQTPKDYGK